jgi:NAD(P)-dependent dehydrogenase (short-subunit alcohol dehydrogenase family)
MSDRQLAWRADRRGEGSLRLAPGAGIPLNAVVPGVVDTPAARVSVLDDPVMRTTVQAAMPQPLGFPGPVEAVASLLEWR